MYSTWHDLDDDWRRRCRLDEELLRFDPPPLEPNLAEAVWARATGIDPPDPVLAGLAAGYAAMLWEAPGEVVQAQLGRLLELALDVASADPKKLARAHTVIAAAAARTAIEGWRNRARTDRLTGLPNRLAMDDDAARLAEDSKLVVAYVDLDGLKAVNDSGGHDAGNTYICAFSEALRAHVAGLGTVYRRGGDEFVVLFDTSPGDAQSSMLQLSEAKGVASFSFGLASRPADGDEISALEREADRRMYTAKQAKKQSGSVQEPAADESAARGVSDVP